MKRTREVINYTHPDERWNLSGCTKFDGEDLSFAERTKEHQRQQKEALMAQMEEKKQRKADEHAQAMQADADRMGIKVLNDKIHDDNLARQRAMKTAHAQQAVQHAKERADREAQHKESENQRDRDDLAYEHASKLVESDARLAATQ